MVLDNVEFRCNTCRKQATSTASASEQLSNTSKSRQQAQYLVVSTSLKSATIKKRK
jgi:hypothetical protein